MVCKNRGMYGFFCTWVLITMAPRKYETDELPNPRPTHTKNNEVESGIFGSLFSNSKSFFVGWD